MFISSLLSLKETECLAQYRTKGLNVTPYCLRSLHIAFNGELAREANTHP